MSGWSRQYAINDRLQWARERSRTFVAYVTGRCSSVITRELDSGREKEAAAAKGLTCLAVAPFTHVDTGLRLEIHRSGFGRAGTVAIEDIATWFDQP